MTPDEPRSPPGPALRRFRPTVRALMLIPVLAAAASLLYLRTVAGNLGPVPIGIKILIPLEFLVLDDATGQPIQGARVDLPCLHPDWRNLADLGDRDLRRDHDPTQAVPPPFVTDEGGRTRAFMPAGKARRLKHLVHGLLPVAGSPEIVFSPISGVRVSADGHETWVKYLDVIEPKDGRKLAEGPPLPIVARLKRASPGPTSPRTRVPPEKGS